MKKRNIFLCLILSFVCVFSVFGLMGCGEASIQTIKDSFAKLDAVYAQNDSIFVEEQVSGLQASHEYLVVSFGTKINQYVDSAKGDFEELKSLYNVAFAISNDYISRNRFYIEGLAENELTSNARTKLTQLNENLKDYTNQISAFLKERAAFVNHFENLEQQASKETNDAVLRRFKSTFGKLLEKNVLLSSSLSEAVESTEIFELLKKVGHDSNDLGIVKEFVRAKLLHIFTDFRVSEISNKMTWASQAEGDSKARIDAILQKLDEQYRKFKEQFVAKDGGYKLSITSEEFGHLFDMTNEFFLEVESYDKALKSLNIESLAIDYHNNLKEYEKKNKLARVYIEKLEQFVSITLPKFMQELANNIFE